MMNTGSKRAASQHGLLNTIAWKIGIEVNYVLEGSIFIGGTVIQWLSDGLMIFEHATGSEKLAESVADKGGVYFVPVLTGLGAP